MLWGMDYRELLKKYMGLIVDSEGVFFTETLLNPDDPNSFPVSTTSTGAPLACPLHEADVRELMKLAKEVEASR